MKDWQIVTLERLFKNFFNESLYKALFHIVNHEDRHTHNIAVLMNKDGQFAYCPIFDNGAGLLSDTTMDYPISGEVYSLISSVKAKTICSDFDEQLDISEKLYGYHLKFYFTKKDVEEILQSAEIYSEDEKSRVKSVLYEQMRKYQYLSKEMQEYPFLLGRG